MATPRTKNLLPALALALCNIAQAQADQSPDMELLTGDTRLACEAILCLSTGERPSECQPAIRRYFSIVRRTLGKTLGARRRFLNPGPPAKGDGCPPRLVNALVDGSGRCAPAALNGRGWMPAGGDNGYYISNAMPASCQAYYDNAGLDVGSVRPIYVGQPERGGRWVDPVNQ